MHGYPIRCSQYRSLRPELPLGHLQLGFSNALIGRLTACFPEVISSGRANYSEIAVTLSLSALEFQALEFQHLKLPGRSAPGLLILPVRAWAVRVSALGIHGRSTKAERARVLQGIAASLI